MTNEYREDDLAHEEDHKEEVVALDDLSYDELLQKTKEFEKQKEHWRKKAKQATQPQEKQEPQPVQKKEEVTQNPESTPENEWKQRIDFVTGAGRDLDAEEVNTVIALARGKGVSYEEALNDSVFKAFKKERDAEKRVQNATPQSKGKAVKVNGKSWSEMSTDEKQANFQTYMKERLGK